MNVYAETPGYFKILFTIGIAWGKWVEAMNKALGQGGAGFAFAWFFPPFANYGLAERLNAAHAARGSSVTVSPIAVFLFTGWPFFGAHKMLARSSAAYGALAPAA